MPKIKVDDINMYYEIHGKGEPIVLIAGLSTDVTEYPKMISELSKHFKVIAFDNRGAGRTDMPDEPYSIEQMADDTAGLMIMLGIRKASVLGVSMGGRIAQVLAIRHPGLVKNLVLVSTSAKNPKPRWWFHLIAFISYSPFLQSKYPQPRYAHLRQRRAMMAGESTDEVKNIQVPTLILHGKKDKIISIELAEAMHHTIKGSKMQSFDGGHSFFFRKNQFINSVDNFLAE